MVGKPEKRFEFDDLGGCSHLGHGIIDIWQWCGIDRWVGRGRDWYHNGGKTSMKHIPRSEWWAYVKWRIRKLFQNSRMV